MSGPSSSRSARTVRLCWATERECSHFDEPPQRGVRARPAARSSRPGVRIGIEGVESASGFEEDEGAKARQGIAAAAVRFEGAHGVDPFVSEKARWASFQSPPSRGGRSRVNGTLNCSAMAR